MRGQYKIKLSNCNHAVVDESRIGNVYFANGKNVDVLQEVQ